LPLAVAEAQLRASRLERARRLSPAAQLSVLVRQRERPL
jgi:hypothetical protein